MYYRGDDFGANPQVPDVPVDAPNVGLYANTPTSDIRAQELAAGRDVAASGFTGGGGFLKELGETAAAIGTFYAPFIPFILPTLLATPVLGGAITAGTKLGGALRPITEAITTGREATTIGPGATSGAPSQEPSIQSLLRQLISSTPGAPSGPAPQFVTSDLVSQARQAQVQPRSRRTPVSRRLSRAQQKALSAAVRLQLQR